MLALIAFSFFAHAAPTEIKFLSASAPSDVPLESILTSTPTPFSGTRNLKISMVFATKIPVARVHLESCKKDWTDGIHVFASPGFQQIFIEGGKTKFDAKLKGPLESLAIVFGHDSEICLRDLKFFDERDQVLNVQATSSVAAKADAPMLFDQHPDSVMALEEPTTIVFDEPQTFDRAFVWTGGSPLFAHTLKITGDKGWHETLPLRSTSADQEIVFRTKFSGRQMTVSAPNAGVVGEIRFALGTKVESVRTQVTQEKKFEEAGFARTLDFSWVTGDSEPDKWTFVFRRDGTFFIRGYDDDQKQAHEYSALGSYTTIRAEQNKIRLKINGARFPSGVPWDGVICPFACGGEGALEGSSLVTDSLMLEKLDEGSIIVRNRTPRAQRTLPLGDLKVRRAVDD